jgi:hypothetical protein
VSASITSLTSCRLSLPVRPTHAAKAPNGTDRAADVPTTQRTSHPVKPASASRAMRRLPTPDAPQTTIPDRSGSDIAALKSRISSARPVNGHAKRPEPSILPPPFVMIAEPRGRLPATVESPPGMLLAASITPLPNISEGKHHRACNASSK